MPGYMMLLYVCAYLSMFVVVLGTDPELAVSGVVTALGAGVLWFHPCNDVQLSCGISTTDGKRPDQCDVTRYYRGPRTHPVSHTCPDDKVYDHGSCTCINKPDCSQTVVKDRRTWMADLPNAKRSIPLNAVAIPGSHNSATGYITPSSELSPDGGDYMNMRQLAIRWSMTQSYTFTQQLNAGVRYFDLRVAYKSGEDKFYFVHDLYCVRVDTALNEVNTFLNTYSGEVVLLDFNHFYKMTTTLHTRFRVELKLIFGSKVCPVTTMSSLTLNYLSSQSKQVLMFYHEALNGTDITNFWPNTSMPAPWANTERVSTLIRYLYFHRNKAETNFQVNQGILTPSERTVTMAMFFSPSKTLKDMAIPALNILLPWVKNSVVSSTKANIFTADFVEKCDFIDTVIQLNY